MTNVIWKYELNGCSSQELRVPANHDILSVDVDNDKLKLYVIVNPEDDEVTLDIHMYPLGVPIFHGKNTYIGCIVLNNRIFHMFYSIR